MGNPSLFVVALLLAGPVAGKRHSVDLDESSALAETGQFKLAATETEGEGQEAGVHCEQFEAKTPDGLTIKISRAKTYSHIAGKIGKALIIVGLIAAVIFLSAYTSTLYETFLSANTPVPVHRLVYSGRRIVSLNYLGMYYKQAAIATLVSSVTMFAGGAGVAGGALLGAAAARIGANAEWKQAQDESHLGGEMKWLGSKEDVCGWVHFDVLDKTSDNWDHGDGAAKGPWANYTYASSSNGLYQLEEDTDAQASDALAAWCSFYAKHRLFGSGDTQPMPDVCRQLLEETPDLGRCGNNAKASKPSTCKDILALSSSELGFKSAMMQMKIIHSASQKAADACDDGDEPDAHVGTTSPLFSAKCRAEDKHDEALCPGETEADFLAGLERVEQGKATALMDCMAVSSCELLRKSGNKIQGKVRSRWSAGLLTQKHMDMLSILVRKCLGHSNLLGPVNATFVCTKGKDCPEDSQPEPERAEFEEMTEEEFQETQKEDEFSCPADEPATLDTSGDKQYCKCIEGAKRSRDDGRCYCIEPDNQNKQAFFESRPKQCRHICKLNLVEVHGDKKADCITRFLYKAIVVAGKSLQQGDCAEGSLSIPVGDDKNECLDKEYVNFVLGN